MAEPPGRTAFDQVRACSCRRLRCLFSVPCPGGACRRDRDCRYLPGLGVLTGEISPELVDEVTGLAGCRQRVRLLPARAVVYFVLGLCLLSSEDSMGRRGTGRVMRSLTHGVRHLAGMAVPSRPALRRARQRLGSKPFELLFDQLRGPLAAAGAAGTFAFGLRVVAWDGDGDRGAGHAGQRGGVRLRRRPRQRPPAAG